MKNNKQQYCSTIEATNLQHQSKISIPYPAFLRCHPVIPTMSTTAAKDKSGKFWKKLGLGKQKASGDRTPSRPGKLFLYPPVNGAVELNANI